MVSNGHACHHAMRNFTTFKVHSGGGRQEQKKKKKNDKFGESSTISQVTWDRVTFIL